MIQILLVSVGAVAAVLCVCKNWGLFSLATKPIKSPAPDNAIKEQAISPFVLLSIIRVRHYSSMAFSFLDEVHAIGHERRSRDVHLQTKKIPQTIYEMPRKAVSIEPLKWLYNAASETQQNFESAFEIKVLDLVRFFDNDCLHLVTFFDSNFKDAILVTYTIVIKFVEYSTKYKSHKNDVRSIKPSTLNLCA